MTDAADSLRLEALVRFEDEMMQEVQLPKGGPVLHLLALSRIEAAEALYQLCKVDAADTKVVQRLQGQIQQHCNLMRWVSEGVNAGRQAWAELYSQQQDEILDRLFIEPEPMEETAY